MGAKFYKARNDPGNYRNGQFVPGWSARRWQGGGGGGGGVHGGYDRGYGGWQFDYDPWSTDLAMKAAREMDAYQTGKTNRTGAYSQLFEQMKQDYTAKESAQKRQQTDSWKMDMLGGMMQLGYQPYGMGTIPSGYMPGQALRSMMGMGGQQRSTPSLMNFFSQMGNRTGRQMFPGFGFGG